MWDTDYSWQKLGAEKDGKTIVVFYSNGNITDTKVFKTESDADKFIKEQSKPRNL